MQACTQFLAQEPQKVSHHCSRALYRGEGGRPLKQPMLRSFCLPPDICQLPSDSGFGDIYQFRSFYNTISKACENFLYKGSSGNANNFWDEDTCTQFCV
uniref:BPTI/Kunitz inhibitor domain-containing protein n=1 Tax=Naja naja TaxID=35670 RepID=A0A8C7E4K2_NAJNA